MGGTLAVDISAALPGKIQKLILVDALPAMRDLMMPGVSADMIQYNSPYNNQTLQLSEEDFRKNATMMAGGNDGRQGKSRIQLSTGLCVLTGKHTYMVIQIY